MGLIRDLSTVVIKKMYEEALAQNKLDINIGSYQIKKVAPEIEDDKIPLCFQYLHEHGLITPSIMNQSPPSTWNITSLGIDLVENL